LTARASRLMMSSLPTRFGYDRFRSWVDARESVFGFMHVRSRERREFAVADRSSLQTEKLLVLAIFASRSTVSPKSGIHERDQVMPTRNVNLTDELDRFVAKKVKTGRYENASEVVRAGLRTLEREEQQYEAKIAALKAAIDAGDASGIAEGNVLGRVRKALKLPVSPR
jgi:antitoxin ParD1/3/4